MKHVIERRFDALANRQGTAPWQGAFVDLLVRVLPFLYGLLWGIFAAVFLGAATSAGESLRIFVPFLSALTGAGLGIWGSRSLRKQDVERERYRSGYEDYLKVRGMVRAIRGVLEVLDELHKQPGATPVDKLQKLSASSQGLLVTRLIALIAQYDDVPTFQGFIDSDHDHDRAHAIREAFAFVRRYFKRFAEADSPNSIDFLSANANYVLSPTTGRNLENIEKALREHGGHFRTKLGVTE